ncbi:MAG TPA: FAD-binding oxidoreductase [Chitinophagales bacterium]|nr:FAD-binding oxidoreductase [Chitinophagales bacterium]
MITEPAKITHHANHKTVTGKLITAENTDDISEAIYVASRTGSNICVLGAQNSFSDIFLGAGQTHISLLKMNKVLAWDLETATVTVEAGMRIIDLLAIILPKGFYLTGLSGSFSDTVAGMVSSNCHGKDSWQYGNFGNNVVGLKLITASCQLVSVTHNEELMKAIIGGLGAFGVITQVTLKLEKLPSLALATQNIAADIKDLPDFSLSPYNYVYAFVGLSSKRSINTIIKTAVFQNNNVAAAYIPANLSSSVPRAMQFLSKALWKTAALVWNSPTYNLVNRLILFLQSHKTVEVQNIVDYLYPWLRHPYNHYIFRNNSFYELQTLFPQQNFNEAVTNLKKLIHDTGIAPILTAAKWHRADDFYLSFSGNGLSLSNTFSATMLNSAEGKKFIGRYIAIVLSKQGRFYLSKFPYLSKEQITASYPRFNDWLDLKKKTDPQSIFLTDRTKTFVT